MRYRILVDENASNTILPIQLHVTKMHRRNNTRETNIEIFI